MINTIEFRFRQGNKKAIIKTTVIKDLKTYEELEEKLDFNYVEFTNEVRNNLNKVKDNE